MTDTERIRDLEAKLAEAERERVSAVRNSRAWFRESQRLAKKAAAAESREKALREALEGIVSTAAPAHAGGDAPGHGHKESGIWDRIEGMSDLGPCDVCAAWRRARAALAAGEQDR